MEQGTERKQERSEGGKEAAPPVVPPFSKDGTGPKPANPSATDRGGDVGAAVAQEIDATGLPATAARAAQDNGVYQVAGVLVGRIDLLDNMKKQVPTPDDQPPPGLRGFRLLRWTIANEARWNPLTVFELYISLIGIVWGGFLLLPYQTFNGTGKLWLPVRTMFGGYPGNGWYEVGAENTVGALLFFVHLAHLWAVCHGKAGDVMRRFTICALLSGWACLVVLFFFADRTVQNWASIVITVGFLFASLRAVFRRAGTR